MKATNSLSTSLVPNRPPAVPASFHGTPIRNMIGCEDVADQPLEAEVGNADHVAEAAEQAVGERDQSDEREHHRADRDRELDAGLRALGGGHDDVGRLLAFLEGLGDVDLVVVVAAALERQLVRAGRSSGMIILAIRMPPGADMKAAASR